MPAYCRPYDPAEAGPTEEAPDILKALAVRLRTGEAAPRDRRHAARIVDLYAAVLRGRRLGEGGEFPAPDPDARDLAELLCPGGLIPRI